MYSFNGKSKAANGRHDQDGARATSESDALINTVDVRLEVVLGDVAMTVAELRSLEKGSILALDTPLNAAAIIRLNGVPVAQGEIVSVGDHFGVRILSLMRDAG